MPYGSKLHIPPTIISQLLNMSHKKKFNSDEKCLRVFCKRSGSLAENDKTERAKGLAKNKRRDLKAESDDSPEISVMEMASDIPSLPSGDFNKALYKIK